MKTTLNMIEVSLYIIPTVDSTVGRLVSRSRYSKENMGVSVPNFVKGFLKDNLNEFSSALKNPELENLINSDTTMTMRDIACLNYYLQKVGFTLKIQNVTDDEENASDIPEGAVEWNIIDYNFIQNDYPTALKITPSESEDTIDILERVIKQSGLFDESKFSGVKNPFTPVMASLKSIRDTMGSVNAGLLTQVYTILDRAGVKVFCATRA